MFFTDTHAHLYSEDYDSDLQDVVAASVEAGVKRIIIPATDHKDHEKVVEICNKYKGKLLPAYGLHPTNIDENTDIEFEISQIEDKILSGAIVAIGETGLDRYWSLDFYDEQVFSLKKHFDLSIKYDLPLIIHARDAFEELIELFREYKGKLTGVVHGFSGTADQAREIASLGDFMFGIGGVCTFKNSKLPEAVKFIPLERIILETDAPYLTPTPYRGKRNSPEFIPLIAKKIAEIKEISVEVVANKTEENSSKIFNLDRYFAHFSIN